MAGVNPDIATAASNAIDSGDPKQMAAVAPLVQGSPVAPPLNNALAQASKAIDPVQDAVNRSQQKGGLNTADGRLTAADSLRSFAGQQTDINVMRGIFMKMANIPGGDKLITQGAITPTTQIGSDGGSVTAWMPSNGGRPTKVQDNKTGNWLNSEQYETGNYGKYSNMESTPGYQQTDIGAKAAAASHYQQLEAANRGSSVLDTIDQNNENGIKPNAIGLGATMSSNEFKDLFKQSNAVTSTRSALSQGMQSLSQNGAYTSYNSAINQARDSGISVNLPKIIGGDSSNGFKADDGKTYKIDELNNMMNTFNSSAAVDQQLSQNRDLIVKSAAFKHLDTPQKQIMYGNMLNAIESNEKLKTSNNDLLSKLPVYSPSMPFTGEQQMGTVISNTYLDHANSQAVALYRDKLLEASKNGVPPSPGLIAASMTIGDNKAALDKIRSNAFLQITNVMNAAKDPSVPDGPKPDLNSQMPSLPVNPSTSKPGQKTQSSNPAYEGIKRGETQSNLPAGIPPGSVKTGEVHKKTGKPYYKTPTGDIYVQD